MTRLLSLLALAGLGYTIHLLLPPAPRCVVRGPYLLRAVAADGSRVMTTRVEKDANGERSFKSLTVWDGYSGRKLGRYLEDDGIDVMGARFSDDRRFCIAAGKDRAAVVDLREGREWFAEDYAPGKMLRLSPRGGFALVPAADREQICVRDSASGALVTRLFSNTVADPFLHVTRDDEWLSFLVDHDDGPALTQWNSRTQQTRTVKGLARHRGEFLSWRVAPDGRTLLTNTSVKSSVTLWDLDTGTKAPLPGLDLFPSEPFVVFAPDSRSVACLLPKEVQIWDVPGRRRRTTIPFDVATDLTGELSISADSRLLVLADRWRYFHVWDLQTGQPLWQRHDPSRAPIECPAVTPDPRYFVEPGSGRIDILDAATGSVHASHRLGDDADSNPTISFTPDGRVMLVPFRRGIGGEPGILERWLGKWWPFPHKSKWQVTVAEVATGRELLRLPIVTGAEWLLAADGCTLVTSDWDGEDSRVISCWDVPARPRWGWVLGVPLGLAGVVWLLRRRRGRESTPIAASTTAPPNPAMPS